MYSITVHQPRFLYTVEYVFNIYVFNHRSALVSIDLSANQLNGTLPHGFGDAFPNLRTLNLAENDIFGGVSDFSGLKSIVSLNIGNLFQGSVTDVFVLKLEDLDLSRNQFQGHISQVGVVSDYDLSKAENNKKRIFTVSATTFWLCLKNMEGILKLFNFLYLKDESRMKIVELGGDKELINMSSTAKDDRTRKAALNALAELSQSESVFVEMEPILRSAMDGHNVCIFAYGQTGTGKTFTMDGTNEQLGSIPRVIEELFRQVSMDASSSFTFSTRHLNEPTMCRCNMDSQLFDILSKVLLFLMYFEFLYMIQWL
ncbi:hypothetical protein KIW84_030977 [Lathyrus oleraceus]|uniref:Kinesin motor domain-containing protein n=1 Tax=Pisum sativum TaxID=3888 RepID=A0A9D5B008_PEA|nr:hypothetical protein KIW84_030977 [Pisum sativum]